MTDAAPLITSLKAAVAAAPGDVPLRVHLAGLLAEDGDTVAAIRHAAAALHASPEDEAARALMGRLLGGGGDHDRPAPADRRPVALGGRSSGMTPPPGLGRRPRPAPDVATSMPSAPTAPTAPSAPTASTVTAAPTPGVPAPTAPLSTSGATAAPALVASADLAAGAATAMTPGPAAAPAAGPTPGAAAAPAPAPNAGATPVAGLPPQAPTGASPQDDAPDHDDPADGDTDPVTGLPRTRRERREALRRQAEAAEEAARVARVARMLAGDPQDASAAPATTPAAPATDRAAYPPAPRPGSPQTTDAGGHLDALDPTLRAALARAQQTARSAAPGAAVPPFAPSGGADPSEPAAGTAHFRPLTIGGPTGGAEPVTLADVAGMEFAKEGLAAAVIEPLRHPEVRGLYRRGGLRGGVLLYGPDGAGKSFLADAIAGEMDAAFLPVDLRRHVVARDVVGLRSALHLARSIQPVLVCLDDVDLLGAAGGPAGAAAAEVVEEFLAGLEEARDGQNRVSVVGTTAAPWDVSPDLRRHGRFDRSMFVTTPDQAARTTLLRRFLAEAGAPDVTVDAIALRTEGYTASDLAKIVDVAVRRTGGAAGVGADALDAARQEVHPASEGWFTRAERIARAAQGDALYAGLVEYLRTRRTG